MNLKTFFAYHPDDTNEVRSEKFAIFLVASLCCLAGSVWTGMYLLVFGFGLISMLPLSFVIIVATALIASHLTRNHRYAIYAQIICIIYVTSFIQWSIGGVFDSGFVLVWAFCGPVTALMFFSIRHSAMWLGLYLVNIAITVAFDDFFSSHAQVVSADTKMLFFVMNLGVSSVVVFAFAGYFVTSAVAERSRANQLLLNILPAKTAQMLKARQGVIAEKHDSASVLFADIVGFTEYSSGRKPDELVTKLNEIFFCFDELSSHYRLEKIKTIGDAYMVVGGLPEPQPDHAESVASLALDMMEQIRNIQKDSNAAFSLRIGIHTGPVVAGVIGKTKFAYDLWGDTVNVASRLESSGVENQIQVSEAVFRKLKDKFTFNSRGVVPIKGKGTMETYFLVGRA